MASQAVIDIEFINSTLFYFLVSGKALVFFYPKISIKLFSYG